MGDNLKNARQNMSNKYPG